MLRYFVTFIFIFFIFSSFCYCNEISDSKIVTDKAKAVYYYQKSANYINNGYSRLAVENLEMSIKFDPSYAISYMILGDLYAGDPIVLDYNKAIEFYNIFLSKMDEDSLVYKSDVYKKIADVYLEMSTIVNLDEKKRIEILKSSLEFYKKSLEAPFSEDNSRNRTLVFISLAYINTKFGNYSKAMFYIDKSDPDISKYLPEYNFCYALINMKLGKDDVAIKYFEKIEKDQSPYFHRASICLKNIIAKKNNENVIFGFLVAIFLILCMVLIFLIYRYFYKHKSRKFSISDLKEVSKGVWKYKDNVMDNLEKISNFTSNILMSLTNSKGAYFFFVNVDRTKLNILDGGNVGEFDFSVVELNHSEVNSKSWFERRGATPFLTKMELSEQSYLHAFPNIADFVKKCNIDIGVPIYYSNWFIGMVYLSHCENLKIYEKNINEIKMFSVRMSHIIAEKIESDSVYIDQQTGLYNGLYYDKMIEDLTKESEKSNTEFSVLRILIDRYQNLEDIFGESYLMTMRNIAIDLINEILSCNLVICIISKCEFSVIVKNVAFDELYSKAVVLHKRISDVHLTYQSDYLTTSMAIGSFSPASFDIETFKSSLESAFIFAINNGGNQIITIDEFIQQEREKLLETAFEDIDENEFDFMNENEYLYSYSKKEAEEEKQESKIEIENKKEAEEEKQESKIEIENKKEAEEEKQETKIEIENKKEAEEEKQEAKIEIENKKKAEEEKQEAKIEIENKKEAGEEKQEAKIEIENKKEAEEDKQEAKIEIENKKEVEEDKQESKIEIENKKEAEEDKQEAKTIEPKKEIKETGKMYKNPKKQKKAGKNKSNKGKRY